MFWKSQAKKEKVFVGLSGGVDSSVSAKRLVDAGYDVVGVFIKTWQPDFLVCNWEAERLDAMRVAAHLGIPFFTCDAEASYRDSVAQYMIEEYKKGRTPNPDVMCNKYVKFGTFLEYAEHSGGVKVATGHYARVEKKGDAFHLYRGADTAKDQSYFLWTLTQEQLSRTLFPVGDTTKNVVRTEAEDAGLLTFKKSDSQGVCFLGDIDMKGFLSHYVTVGKGSVLSEHGDVVGIHDGALYYTLGQRHGFVVTSKNAESEAHYVISKDLEANTITVGSESKKIAGEQILLDSVNEIQTIPEVCEAQFRYRQKPFKVSVVRGKDATATVAMLDSVVEMPSLGQSCVLYKGDACLGGGIIQGIA